MNITQAKAAMRKLWGAKAAWRYDESAPKADEREQLKSTLVALSVAASAARELRERRKDELLRDPEYVRLCAEYTTLSEEHETVRRRTNHYRVTVGYSTTLAFHVEAQADNWQDAIDHARAAQTRI